MKKIIALSSLLALGALGIACGDAAAPNKGNTAANGSNTRPAGNTTASPMNTAAPGNTTSSTNSDARPADTAAKTDIGVPACDEYFAKLDEYLSNPKVPEAVKTQYQKTREDNLKAWKAAAATDAGKAGLETGCKAATDALKSLPQM